MPSAATLLIDLLDRAAERTPAAVALVDDDGATDYARLAHVVHAAAAGMKSAGLRRRDRVAVYLDKRTQTVAALFAASAAGAVVVPVNPALKPAQVAHILSDCGVALLVTSPERLASLSEALGACRALHTVVLSASGEVPQGLAARVIEWGRIAAAPPACHARAIDADLAAIFYTSGSTGRPKGVMVSHRNLLAGAQSVASYLGNHAGDALLAALPLSFDAGFSQLTTAFHAGATVVLHNYLLPLDLVRVATRHGVTGLTAVPPLYAQLVRTDWPAGAFGQLRYFANTGGHMPQSLLATLRQRLPHAQPFLMYGLTEAFRSTFLPPAEVDRRPDSMGRAIPNAEVLVLRPDGNPCEPGETGELVHRGALVALGYWNDPALTALRFRPLPPTLGGAGAGASREEVAVFSGDLVRADADGYLYFVGRNDDLIKSSGYRVSPTEVEEVLYAAPGVAECAVLGLPDAQLGQAIGAVLLMAPGHAFDGEALAAHCRRLLPGFMVPTRWLVLDGALPRNANGKIDRRALAVRFGPAPG